ncbi:MAG: type II secretion system F family protein [Armatimonadetes bacterium]|nr:type II secretion system F family protein [Armatimonadota bacterium]
MNEENVPLVDLVPYLRVFSLLINAGVCLINAMDILTGQITHEGLRDAHRDIMRRIGAGSTLSEAMRDHADVFSTFLVGLVRAGEVGGVLDETMAQAADFHGQQLTLRRDRLVQQAAARITGQAVAERYDAALAEAEPLTLLQYFCMMFGTMLGSGVPIVQALQTAAGILPPEGSEAMRAAAQALRAREINTLAPAFAEAGFPPEVVKLVAIGEETGTLDRTMLQAGDVLGARGEGMLLRALWE